VVKAVERVVPAVVNIGTVEEVRERNPFSLFEDPLFEDFFDRYFERRSGSAPSRRNLGSGLVVRRDGYILTNHHVIARARRILITTRSGQEREAVVVGADPQFDLAVLKVEGGDLPEAPLGDSDDLMVGETVVAIGNPFGLSHTVTTGVIGAVRRSIKAEGERIYSDFIQTDASINPGNSGGPLVNILGEVIGINTAIYRGGEGIGFAIPINVARKVMRELIDYGRVHRGWFGLLLRELTPELRRSLGHPEGGGALVAQVAAPWLEGKVTAGDILLSFGGRPVTGPSSFAELAAGYLPGEEAEAAILHRGSTVRLRLPCRALSLESAVVLFREMSGISLGRAEGKAGSARVVDGVDRGSHAARIGIAYGDLILALGGQSLEDDQDLIQAVAGLAHRQFAPLVLQRGRSRYTLTLNLAR
jgi:serine protease Do